MKKSIEWPRLALHLGAWLTLTALILNFFFNPQSINPVLTLEHQTGKAALVFLILSLTCSPLAAILDRKALGKRKKALGVYGFMFAAVHLLVFLGVDYRFRFGSILPVILHSPYLWIGLAAFVMLLALAVTSFKKMKQALKKNWKRLHRLAYVISPLVVIHFLLVVKGNLLRLQGNLAEPLIYGGLILLLLLMRLPPVKRAMIKLRENLSTRHTPANPV